MAMTTVENASQGYVSVHEDFSGAVFERMIIIMPYSSPVVVKGIEAMFEQINLLNLNLESANYLSTKELTEVERADRSLDYLGGFEIIDKEFRLFIIEGLGGTNHAMHAFYKAN